MIDFWRNLDLWQKILIVLLAVLLVVSIIAYIRELVFYKKRKKVKDIPLTLVKFTEDNYLVIKKSKQTDLTKTYRIYMNDTRSKFKFDFDDSSIFYVKASDIFENNYKFEFCLENGIIFAKGNIEIDDAFPRPYAKKTNDTEVHERIIKETRYVTTIATKEEPVKEEPVEEVKEEPVEEVVEEPVEEVKEEPVEEVKEEPVEEVKEEPVEEAVVEEAVTEDNDSDSEESEVIYENGKKIVISYNYSFSAKLIQSDEVVRDWYSRYLSEIESYKDLKYKQSWKKIRVYKGRKTLAIIKFRGKKICMAYALDPKKYEDTKYSGIDLSDKKSYQDTPMMLKTTSDRRFNYQLYLLNVVCTENGLEQGEVVQKTFEIPEYMERDELINKELVKVNRKEMDIDAPSFFN